MQLPDLEDKRHNQRNLYFVGYVEDEPADSSPRLFNAQMVKYHLYDSIKLENNSLEIYMWWFEAPYIDGYRPIRIGKNRTSFSPSGYKITITPQAIYLRHGRGSNGLRLENNSYNLDTLKRWASSS